MMAVKGTYAKNIEDLIEAAKAMLDLDHVTEIDRAARAKTLRAALRDLGEACLRADMWLAIGEVSQETQARMEGETVMDGMLHTKDCPCCDGAGVHRKQAAVDDFVEVGCGSCVEGQVSICQDCGGDGYIETGDRWVEGKDYSGLVAGATDCLECGGTGLEDYTACDLAKTLQRKRVRPASEDFK